LVITVWSILPAQSLRGQFQHGIDGNILAGEISARENMPLISYDPRTPQFAAPTGCYIYQGRNPACADSLVTELAETPSGTGPMPQRRSATDNILSSCQHGGGGTVFLALRDESAGTARAAFFQCCPPGHRRVAELGFNLAGRVSPIMPRTAAPAIFAVGVSATICRMESRDDLYGFLGAPTRQPMADRNFCDAELQRTSKAQSGKSEPIFR